jgi:cytochrome c553
MHLTRYQAVIICAALWPASIGSSVGQPADDRFGASAAPSVEEPRERPKQAARPPAQKQKASPPKARAAGEPKPHKKAQPKAPAVAQPRPAETPSVPVPAARPAIAAPPPAQPAPAQPPAQPAQAKPQTAPAAPSPQANPAPPPAPPVLADEKLALCFACHGPAGRSETPQMPSLAAQPAPFIFAQLKMMLEGKRKIDAMQPVMPEFSEANIRIYAEKISKLPKPPAPASAPNDMARYDRGQKLAAASRCANCHNNDFSGAGTNPSLARQRDDYLVKALRDYKSGARVDAGGIMVASVKDLKDSDFIDLAYYLANLR